MCVLISQPKWIPAKRPVVGLHLSLLTSKELSSWESLLNFENKKNLVFYLLSGQGPVSSQLSYY